jgi:hypothetical protein
MRFVTREELGIALDDHPAGVHTGPARIGDQRHEHLGDAAPACRRVDAPHDPAGQQPLCARDRGIELTDLLRREHVPEALPPQRRDRDVGELRARLAHTAFAPITSPW